MLTLFSQIMVNVKFPYVVYRKGAGLQIRSFALFKLFPVSEIEEEMRRQTGNLGTFHDKTFQDKTSTIAIEISESLFKKPPKVVIDVYIQSCFRN